MHLPPRPPPDGVVVDGIKDDEEDDGSDSEGILVRVQSENHKELYKTSKVRLCCVCSFYPP